MQFFTKFLLDVLVKATKPAAFKRLVKAMEPAEFKFYYFLDLETLYLHLSKDGIISLKQASDNNKSEKSIKLNFMRNK